MVVTMITYVAMVVAFNVLIGINGCNNNEIRGNTSLNG